MLFAAATLRLPLRADAAAALISLIDAAADAAAISLFFFFHTPPTLLYAARRSPDAARCRAPDAPLFIVASVHAET